MLVQVHVIAIVTAIESSENKQAVGLLIFLKFLDSHRTIL